MYSLNHSATILRKRAPGLRSNARSRCVHYRARRGDGGAQFVPIYEFRLWRCGRRESALLRVHHVLALVGLDGTKYGASGT